MAAGAGPYTPKAGWEWRWFVQACQLCLRAPEALILFAGWVLVAGAVIVGLRPHIPSISAAILLIASMSAASVPAVTACHWFLMRSEGHGGGLGRVLRGSREAALVALAVNSIFILLALLLPPIVPVADIAAGPRPSEIDQVLRGGILTVTAAHVATLIIMPLWLPAIAGLIMPLSQARLSGVLILVRMPRVFLALTVGIFGGIQLARLLPPVVGVAVTFLLISWTYVAAREIFGGISENGERAARLVPST
ncbi:hypothetical protein [Defluviimonas salinarum]|uniref:Uncharacterized protein n=1 Tax=Defluviimonas salinarum TaxID=2992147 RepID=A0ABT3J4G5_9RHOB|nr:hypothetical protein [Defluviimonas salinarum]MCW3782558.1 hypothetical protein [Defluviimonas salinarum]